MSNNARPRSRQMTFVEDEIATQPECWEAVLEHAASPLLPAPGERVAVVGCGTSWFVAQAYAALREAAGLGETDAFAASEMPADRRYGRGARRSRSSTSVVVLDLLRRVSTPTL